MVIDALKEQLSRSVKIKDIFKELSRKQNIRVKGIKYSLKAFFLDQLKEKYKQILFLADSVDSCERLRDDFHIVAGESCYSFLLPGEVYPYCSSSIDDERKGDRLLALNSLYENSYSVILSTYRNLFEKLPVKDKFSELSFDLKADTEIDVERFRQKLVDNGFSLVHTVENIGEFSIKGSIIDIYPYASEYPVRVELFDNEIESIRLFDPVNQRKVAEKKNLRIHFNDVNMSDLEAHGNLFDLLAEDTLIIIDDCDDFNLKLNEYYDSEIIAGYERRKDDNKIHYEKKYFTQEDIFSKFKSFKSLVLQNTDTNVDSKVSLRDPGAYQYDFKSFLDSLKNNVEKGYFSYILCDNPGQAERFIEILEEETINFKKLKVMVCGLHEGFIFPEVKVAVYTDHQIFGRIKRPKNFRRFKKAVPLKDIKRLNYSDFVVHQEHGIGQYLGLEKIKVAGSVRDVLKITYKGNDILYVKLDSIHLIQKYKAADGILPALSKLGSKQFKALKERTKKSVKSIARELIKLYAKRKEAKGFAYPSDTIWQTEMEASFEFEDTIDQAKATKDLKEDMESSLPMDRLVCGDVGFGKTEVAIRAAFKAAISGKQVAVLAPTTILVHQHLENFKRRIDRYPIKLAALSRFRSKMEQSAILHDLAEGKIDIVIGTHRLLSKDVVFKNIGLLVIDEEQRFGVAHKERIKEIKVNVDVLTLTATPIPRTLHMSLMGVRDLSTINTPPTNRLPIKTEVHTYNEDIVFEAIMKEVDRGGQVFFIHNRVESIETVKMNLEKIVPDVSIAVAHGQMKPKQLEEIMMNFLYKRYDVLIATTIIESGVDIPNVNTLIVNRADMFGLSQLYQIRGRIGRSSRQAYAYFLTPPSGRLNPIAKKRLETVSEFTDLGSGFQIAMKDLEIRGAGNLLGKSQSGFIENVGFDLYTSILEEAVQELKAEEFGDVLSNVETKQIFLKTQVNLKQKMYFPETYVPDDSERVELYRRMMNCNTLEQVAEVREEVKDRFGTEPEEAYNLFENLILSIIGGDVLVKSINLWEEKNVWFLKFVLDQVEMEVLDNTEKALCLQDNVMRIITSGLISSKLEEGGNIVVFTPDSVTAEKKEVIPFALKCLKELGKGFAKF